MHLTYSKATLLEVTPCRKNKVGLLSSSLHKTCKMAKVACVFSKYRLLPFPLTAAISPACMTDARRRGTCAAERRQSPGELAAAVCPPCVAPCADLCACVFSVVHSAGDGFVPPFARQVTGPGPVAHPGPTPGPHADACALIIPGPGRSSAYDHALNVFAGPQ